MIRFLFPRKNVRRFKLLTAYMKSLNSPRIYL